MNWLLSPLTWLLLATVLGAIAWCVRARWLAAACSGLAVVAFAGMTPLVANSLLAYLEQPLAGTAQCRDVPPATAVVLAGGVDRLPQSQADFAVMNLASRRRMERGVQYWRDRDGRQVVLVGGTVATGSIANAELMRAYARWVGLPESALRVERQSSNTWENARNVATLVPRLPRRIALVTSALHMPRARMAFAAAGFDVCPLPTDFRTVPIDLPSYLLPRGYALLKTEAALHELVGLGYYRWRDWVRSNRAATDSSPSR